MANDADDHFAALFPKGLTYHGHFFGSAEIAQAYRAWNAASGYAGLRTELARQGARPEHPEAPDRAADRIVKKCRKAGMLVFSGRGWRKINAMEAHDAR